jgi:hypothetical protein
MCRDAACTGVAVEPTRRRHAQLWRPMAEALIEHERPAPLTLGD